MIECKRQFLESRIRVKYVKGRLKDAHVILAMANGQIKGAGNADKGASIRYMKKFDAVLILLILLDGCGDEPY